MSCEAGVLTEAILPNSALWNSAYVILYSGSKPILASHYHAALASAAAYISHCGKHAIPVDPMRLFYLAGRRSTGTAGTQCAQNGRRSQTSRAGSTPERLLLKHGASPKAGLSQVLIDQANNARDFEIAEMLEAALKRHQEG